MKPTLRPRSHKASPLRVLPPCEGLDLTALVTAPPARRRPALGQVVSFLTGRTLASSSGQSITLRSTATRASVPSVSPCMTSASTETPIRCKIIPFAMLAASRPSAA